MKAICIKLPTCCSICKKHFKLLRIYEFDDVRNDNDKYRDFEITTTTDIISYYKFEFDEFFQIIKEK